MRGTSRGHAAKGREGAWQGSAELRGVVFLCTGKGKEWGGPVGAMQQKGGRESGRVQQSLEGGVFMYR